MTERYLIWVLWGVFVAVRGGLGCFGVVSGNSMDHHSCSCIYCRLSILTYMYLSFDFAFLMQMVFLYTYTCYFMFTLDKITWVPLCLSDDVRQETTVHVFLIYAGMHDSNAPRLTCHIGRTFLRTGAYMIS